MIFISVNKSYYILIVIIHDFYHLSKDFMKIGSLSWIVSDLMLYLFDAVRKLNAGHVEVFIAFPYYSSNANLYIIINFITLTFMSIKKKTDLCFCFFFLAYI